MTLINDRWTRAARYAALCWIVLAALFFQPAYALSEARADGPDELTLPDFADFVEQVRNGEADVLRGVYVPDVLALPVSQQPAGDPNYVSMTNGEATQFSAAAQLGNIGLLAHNTLSGRWFSELVEGQQVRLVYGDGKVEYFIVSEVLRFQALEPRSAWSAFRSEEGEEVLTAGQMFERVYSGERHVTFQTCIQAYGNINWGRLFVMAVPVGSHGFRLRPRELVANL